MEKKLIRRQGRTERITTSATDTLKETLAFHKVSQKEFAFRLGVSQAHISDILLRRKFMSEELALKIEAVTGLQAEFLLRRDFLWKMEQMHNRHADFDNLEKFEWALEE
ncbi:MAG: transcriptional regulator [Streptococcaceae bacterium]|jgi:plasmid maintenance system antidote protein VapI|nr:transcriptional regulator [Streptococcaceae bacterium]